MFFSHNIKIGLHSAEDFSPFPSDRKGQFLAWCPNCSVSRTKESQENSIAPIWVWVCVAQCVNLDTGPLHFWQVASKSRISPRTVCAPTTLTSHLCFAPCQAEVRAVLGRLGGLLRSPTLSARDLQAAAGGSPGGAPRPPACGRLIRHLLLSFLLWAPGGHLLAREVISLVSIPFLASSFSFTSHSVPDLG